MVKFLALILCCAAIDGVFNHAAIMHGIFDSVVHAGQSADSFGAGFAGKPDQ